MIETNCNKALNMLTVRERNEWHYIDKYYSEIPKDERFENFKNEIKKINLNEMPEALYREWRYHRDCIYEKDFVKQFENFIKKWPKDFKYDELIKISDELLDEWHKKCNYEYIYEYYDTVAGSPKRLQKRFESKSKSELWEEFKEFWLLDDTLPSSTSSLVGQGTDNFPNMEVFNEIKKSVEDYENEFDDEEFFEFREDANYHSYDSYSIAEQYRICKEFEEN